MTVWRVVPGNYRPLFVRATSKREAIEKAEKIVRKEFNDAVRLSEKNTKVSIWED